MLVATLTHDQQTAERANAILADDKPPAPPWQQQDAVDERWSEGRLEADLRMGVRWPFFRDTSHDRDALNGHNPETEKDEEASSGRG